jgi:hypothetical protein
LQFPGNDTRKIPWQSFFQFLPSLTKRMLTVHEARNFTDPRNFFTSHTRLQDVIGVDFSIKTDNKGLFYDLEIWRFGALLELL